MTKTNYPAFVTETADIHYPECRAGGYDFPVTGPAVHFDTKNGAHRFKVTRILKVPKRGFMVEGAHISAQETRRLPLWMLLPQIVRKLQPSFHRLQRVAVLASLVRALPGSCCQFTKRFMVEMADLNSLAAADKRDVRSLYFQTGELYASSAEHPFPGARQFPISKVSTDSIVELIELFHKVAHLPPPFNIPKGTYYAHTETGRLHARAAVIEPADEATAQEVRRRAAEEDLDLEIERSKTSGGDSVSVPRSLLEKTAEALFAFTLPGTNVSHMSPATRACREVWDTLRALLDQNIDNDKLLQMYRQLESQLASFISETRPAPAEAVQGDALTESLQIRELHRAAATAALPSVLLQLEHYLQERHALTLTFADVAYDVRVTGPSIVGSNRVMRPSLASALRAMAQHLRKNERAALEKIREVAAGRLAELNKITL